MIIVSNWKKNNKIIYLLKLRHKNNDANIDFFLNIVQNNLHRGFSAMGRIPKSYTNMINNDVITMA